ncbi:MAG: glycosyltransferase [Epsilonproteobacteria bacterium]|nr:glycosyltransferase [Campylobacterota bacterium]
MSSSKRVATLVFNPFVNDSRVLKEATSLGRNGYQITVIAHGGKKLKDTESSTYFNIQRVSYLDRTIPNSTVIKLKAYLKYIKEAISYAKSFDCVHCNDLNTLPIGVFIKIFLNKNIKIIYDAHEYETETNGLKGIQKGVIKVLERFLIPYANKVITVSDSIANAYVKLYNIPKPILILNTPPYQEIEKKNLLRKNLNILEEQIIFLYQGGLSYGRGIETLLETFKQQQNKESHVLVLMGYGALEEKIKEDAKKYKNIYFHPAVSPNVLIDYTASADFGVSTIEDSCLSYRFCLPNKLFEYMMAEIPVIVSNLDEMKNFVHSHQVGIIAEENSTKGLHKAIEKALMSDRNRLLKEIKKVKATQNWQVQEERLLKLYKELVT